MNTLCIYCGSGFGNKPVYRKYAEELGAAIADKGITLVYGGGKVGLMGVIADTVMSRGGNVIGVIPRFLDDKELAHTGLSELILVDSMHQRKQKMADLSDGFIAMPGGFGTFEEIFEIITWGQLSLHRKPCAFLNVEGYYDGFRNMIDTAVGEGFISEEFGKTVIFDNNPENILSRCIGYKPEKYDKAREKLGELENR